MSNPAISKGTRKYICSQALGAGHSPSDKPVGRRLALFSRGLAPVNPSPPPENAKAGAMIGTSGRRCFGSRESFALSESLASRLKERLASVGSMEFHQTWKRKVTPSGRSYWAHTASARRTSAKEFTGWPTPRTVDASNESISTKKARNERLKQEGKSKGCGSPTLPQIAGLASWPTPQARDGTGADVKRANGQRMNLNDYSELVGWNTPRATDGSNGGPNQAGGALSADAALAGWASPRATDVGRQRTPEAISRARAAGGGSVSLEDQACLTGWATPSSRDWKDTPGMAKTGTSPDGSTRTRLDQLPRQVSGPIPSPSPAPTESSAESRRLNPKFSAWLQGFPPAWIDLAPTASPSRRRQKAAREDLKASGIPSISPSLSSSSERLTKRFLTVLRDACEEALRRSW